MGKDTRQKLLTTAEELIIASSYASVGVAEICKQAGVNKGSFYHFFESKEELAIAALESGCKQFNPILEEIFSPEKTALEQLDGYVDLFYSFQEESFKKYGKVCGCPAVNLGSEMATQNQHFYDSVNKIMQHYESYYISLVQAFIKDGLIDKNTDAEVLGKILHTYVLGLKVTSKVENDPFVLQGNLKPTLLRILGVQQ